MLARSSPAHVFAEDALWGGLAALPEAADADALSAGGARSLGDCCEWLLAGGEGEEAASGPPQRVQGRAGAAAPPARVPPQPQALRCLDSSHAADCSLCVRWRRACDALRP